MDRLLLILSTACFLGGFCYALVSLGAGKYRPSRANLAVIALGFAFQTWFLYLRGQEHGRTPVTNLFEVFVFLSWSLVLMYFVFGPTYRLSLLGVFTSPLVFLFQAFALLSNWDQRGAQQASGEHGPWMPFHASISIMAYGAFALAFVAGVMFLLQDWQLKSRKVNTILHQLPPIEYLGKAIVRVLCLGFVLLTAGMVSAFGIDWRPHWWKLASTIAVWVCYAVLLAAVFLGKLSPRRIAVFSAAAFVLAVSTLWGISFLSE